jgi:hypothetical protein
MTNLLEQAINSNTAIMPPSLFGKRSASRATTFNYVFPKTWPGDREQRASIIGEWLQD